MSRECHNQKPQPTPDTKRKRKWTKVNACKINKHVRDAHRPAPSPPGEVITMLKGLNKQNKEQSMTQHEAPRSINHKATQNKNNPGPQNGQ